MARNKILVAEDDSGVRFGVRDFLTTRGYQLSEADSCKKAEEVFTDFRPDAAIIDYRLPDGDALQLLPRFREIDPHVPLVILTGYGSIELAVQAIKQGADHFLTKPVELPSLLVILERLLDVQRIRRKQMARRSATTSDELDPFQGTSAAIRQLAEQAQRIAAVDSPVLIQGETGTGKSVLARWLHAHGSRCEEVLVELNCAGLSRDLLDTELFGHERGAFTGAVNCKTGLLEIGHRGIVLLDEIGDMDVAVQPKLLKVLEEKRFRRVGGVRDIQVDLRLISATHQDLAQLVGEKKFRSDLYYRINTIPLVLPPLRKRIEDIPLLARTLLERLVGELGRCQVTLSQAAVELLQRYDWPGNIRELRNVLERALLLSATDIIGPKELRFDIAPAAGGDYDTRITLQELERRHIQRVLEEEQGHVESAAARLGISRSSLYQKIKAHGIPTSRF